jgi:hypothetical protein
MAELLLHPVRLRIMQAFLGGRALTTADLGAELADIPPASLYRHVARLVDAGVLTVVAQRQVRGAVERTYEMGERALIGADEFAGMTADQHRQAFLIYVSALIDHFDRYLARTDIDPPRDGVGYRMTGLWLDDTELAELQRGVAELFAPYLMNTARPGRRRRLLGTVLLPMTERES